MNMFSNDIILCLLCDFIGLTGRAAFCRICAATSQISVTAAQVVRTPLSNALRIATTDAPQACHVQNLVRALRFGGYPLETAWSRVDLNTPARLQVFLIATAGEIGDADLNAYDAAFRLALAITGRRGRVPFTREQLWHEVLDGSGLSEEASRGIKINRMLPFICEMWLQEHPGEDCNIRSILLMMLHNRVPPLVRARPMIRHILAHAAAQYGRRRTL